MLDECQITKEEMGYALIHDTTANMYTVVRINREDRQVYSAMPTDGDWFSNISDKGVRYVASLYSRGYARRIYRDLVSLARETRVVA